MLRLHLAEKLEPVVQVVRTDAEDVVAELRRFLAKELGLLALGLPAVTEEVSPVDGKYVVRGITNRLVKGGPPGQPA
jgi:hypothetical protein